MKILVVDDEALQRDMLAGFLSRQGYDVVTAADGQQALRCVAEDPVALVLLDHRMPDINGDELLAQIKRLNPLVRAIMITAYGSVDTAVRVMRLGADDFLEKPVDLQQMLAKIEELAQRITIETEAAAVSAVMQERDLPLKIVGESPAIREALSMVQRLAPTPFPVLIHGETGTGKELFARLIHLLGPGADGPFVAVNCGAVPENLFESELFGHEKGAFTGAAARRRGRFEQAEGGTLFFDEIGELPLPLQPKLLRALQEMKIAPVGGEKEIAVSVRVVAATSRDLPQMAAEGRFREDLYYRLKVLDIEIPPLRRRREDIAVLARAFLERYALRPLTLSPEAMDALVKYSFPGNVRELEHVIQRTATLARGSVIRPTDLPGEIRFHQAASAGTLVERLNSVEREMILAAMEKAGGVQTRAAEALGISERVLRYKLRRLNIR